jgi:hypothetical protein
MKAIVCSAQDSAFIRIEVDNRDTATLEPLAKAFCFGTEEGFGGPGRGLQFPTRLTIRFIIAVSVSMS